MCIGKMMSGMDKWFVIDEVLPMLLDIPSKEPAVLMGSLGKVLTLCMVMLVGFYIEIWE